MITFEKVGDKHIYNITELVGYISAALSDGYCVWGGGVSINHKKGGYVITHLAMIDDDPEEISESTKSPWDAAWLFIRASDGAGQINLTHKKMYKGQR